MVESNDDGLGLNTLITTQINGISEWIIQLVTINRSSHLYSKNLVSALWLFVNNPCLFISVIPGHRSSAIIRPVTWITASQLCAQCLRHPLVPFAPRQDQDREEGESGSARTHSDSGGVV